MDGDVIESGEHFTVSDFVVGSGGRGGGVQPDVLRAVMVYCPALVYVWLMVLTQLLVVQADRVCQGVPSPKLTCRGQSGSMPIT